MEFRVPIMISPTAVDVFGGNFATSQIQDYTIKLDDRYSPNILYGIISTFRGKYGSRESQLVLSQSLWEQVYAHNNGEIPVMEQYTEIVLGTDKTYMRFTDSKDEFIRRKSEEIKDGEA